MPLPPLIRAAIRSAASALQATPQAKLPSTTVPTGPRTGPLPPPGMMPRRNKLASQVGETASSGARMGPRVGLPPPGMMPRRHKYDSSPPDVPPQLPPRPLKAEMTAPRPYGLVQPQAIPQQMLRPEAARPSNAHLPPSLRPGGGVLPQQPLPWTMGRPQPMPPSRPTFPEQARPQRFQPATHLPTGMNGAAQAHAPTNPFGTQGTSSIATPYKPHRPSRPIPGRGWTTGQCSQAASCGSTSPSNSEPTCNASASALRAWPPLPRFSTST